MPREWTASCKDCGKEYGYSDASYVSGALRGMSRPERCPTCRKQHSRETATFGLSHFDLTPLRDMPADGLLPGRLGGLIRPARVHKPTDSSTAFDFERFGIKNSHLLEYFELVQKHQVTVIVAPTGAGKSTLLPYRLMVPPPPFPPDLFTRNGQIVITQPRIQATRNIPAFVAQKLHGSQLGPGFDIGFKHMGTPATDWRNKLVYLTDGSLISMITRNELNRFSVIMIDEAHERSDRIDLILGLLRLQLPRYPKLRLIVASATINAELFVNFFGGPDKVGLYEFPGERQFEVKTLWHDRGEIKAKEMPGEVAARASSLLREIQANTRLPGDILCFLHGRKPIEAACKQLTEEVKSDSGLAGKVDVLPLFAALPQRAQDAALLPKRDPDRFRVVIATNVAETSLTVEGIVHVVDSGLINESNWDAGGEFTYIDPKCHSQAGCKQRWGRAGRIQPGEAHCLYTEAEFARFPQYTEPEIRRMPLDTLALTAKAAGVDNIETFSWIEPPPQLELTRTKSVLEQMGAVDQDGDLTAYGAEIRDFFDGPAVANLMILSDRLGCAVEMAAFVVALKNGGLQWNSSSVAKLLKWDRGWDADTMRTVNRIHTGLIGSCRDDLEAFLKIWVAWERAQLLERQEGILPWEEQFFINRAVIKKYVRERDLLLASLSVRTKGKTTRPLDLKLLNRLKIVLVFGLSRHIYALASNEPPLSSGQEGRPARYEKWSMRERDLAISEPQAENPCVELAPGSVLGDQRKLPQYIISVSRNRYSRRSSPFADPDPIVQTSFAVAIEEEWLSVVGKKQAMLAMEIGRLTRDNERMLLATLDEEEFFFDQYFPIGAAFECQVSAGEVTVGQLLRLPAHFLPSDSLSAEEPADDLAEQMTGVCASMQMEYEVDPGDPDEPEADTLDDGADLEDGQPPDSATSTPDEAERRGHVYLQRSRAAQGRLLCSVDAEQLEAVVTGFEFNAECQGRVLLEPCSGLDRFLEFVRLYKEFDDVQVQLVGVEFIRMRKAVFLIVREVKTGLEVALQPIEVGFQGLPLSVEVLREAAPGETLQMSVQRIDSKKRRVNLSYHKAAEEAKTTLTRRFAQHPTVPGRIVDINEREVSIWLDPERTRLSPVIATTAVGYIPRREEHFRLNSPCWVKLQSLAKRKEQWVQVRGSTKTLEALELNDLGGGVMWDARGKRLSKHGVIGYALRAKLQGLTVSSDVRKALDDLYRRSHKLPVAIVDTPGLEVLEQHQAADTPVAAQITGIRSAGLHFVTSDGFQGFVPRDQLGYEAVDPLASFHVGEALDVRVVSARAATGESWFTLRHPDQDPVQTLALGDRVKGSIHRVDEARLLLVLEGAVEGIVLREDACWQSETDLRDLHAPGQEVTARIVEIDPANRRVRLSLLSEESDPVKRFPPRTLVDVVIKEIADRGMYVEIEAGLYGFIPAHEASWVSVENPASIWSPNQVVSALIVNVHKSTRHIVMSLRMPDDDPFQIITVGQHYEGELASFYSEGEGVFVLLSSGSEAFVAATELTLRRDRNLDSFSLGQSLSVKITYKDAEKRIIRGTVIRAYEDVLYIPNAYRSLAIGPGGRNIERLRYETGAGIDLGPDGYCRVFAPSKSQVTDVMQFLAQTLAQRMVRLELAHEMQADWLIGPQGSLIRQLEDDFRVSIQRESAQCFFIVAPDEESLQRTMSEIDRIVFMVEARVIIPPEQAGRVIGRGGETVKDIRTRAQCWLTISDAVPGLVTIEANMQEKVELAIDLVGQCVSEYYVEAINRTLPPRYDRPAIENPPT